MLKLSIGDLGFMAFGLFAVLLMLLLDFGAPTRPDPVDERRACEKFLTEIDATWSPALIIASIVGASFVAYVIVAVSAKLA
jgi:hypothetical protein